MTSILLNWGCFLLTILFCASLFWWMRRRYLAEIRKARRSCRNREHCREFASRDTLRETLDPQIRALELRAKERWTALPR